MDYIGQCVELKLNLKTEIKILSIMQLYMDIRREKMFKTRKILRQQMEMLSEESGRPEDDHDLAELSKAMASINKELVRGTTSVVFVFGVLTYFIILGSCQNR